MRVAVSALVVLVVGVAGCGEPHVVITVEARPTVHGLALLDVSVRDPDGEAGGRRFEIGDGELPATLVIATDGRRGPLSVAVQAFGDDGLIVAEGGAETGVSGDGVVMLEPSDFVVNARVSGDQRQASEARRAGRNVAVGDDGGFLVGFESNGGIALRLFDEAARPRTNAWTLNDLDIELPRGESFAGQPSLAAGHGEYLVVWEHPIEGFEPIDLRASVLGGDGAPVTFDVAVPLEDDASRRFGRPVPLGDGWVVAYQVPTEPFDIFAGELRAQRLDGAGAPVGPEIAIAAGAEGHNGVELVATDDGFVAAWEESAAGPMTIATRAFAADGTPRGDAVTVVESGMPTTPRLARWGDGLALVWYDFAAASAPFFLRRLDARGAVDGEPVLIAETTFFSGFDADHASVVERGDGTLAIAWADGEAEAPDVWLRRVSADGAPCGEPRPINTTREGGQVNPSLAAFGDALLAVWDDRSTREPDTSQGAVRARVLYDDAPCP